MSRRYVTPVTRPRLRRLRAAAGGHDSTELGPGLRHSGAVFHLFFSWASSRTSLRASALACLAGSMNPPHENVPLENLLGLFLNFQYLVEDAIGYVEFIELGERELAAVTEKQGDDVGVGVEACAGLGDVVSDDHVGRFALELAAGVFGEVVCFGGEPTRMRLLLAAEFRREYRAWVRAPDEGAIAAF